MAISLDKARDALKNVPCAATEFTQPTPRVFPQDYQIKASVVDGHIETFDTEGTITAPVHVTQAAYPIIDFSTFWLAKVARTERFA